LTVLTYNNFLESEEEEDKEFDLEDNESSQNSIDKLNKAKELENEESLRDILRHYHYFMSESDSSSNESDGDFVLDFEEEDIIFPPRKKFRYWKNEALKKGFSPQKRLAYVIREKRRKSQNTKLTNNCRREH